MRYLQQCILLYCVISTTIASGQNWDSVGCGFNASVNTLYSDSTTSTLYAGGYFKYEMCDSTIVRRIAQFDGVKWDSVGSGWVNPSGPLQSATVYNDKLYAQPIAYNAFTGLATLGEWDGTSWSEFALMNGGASNMEVLNGDLYVMGTFDSIGGIYAKYIAKWNGSEWIDLQFGDYAVDGYGIFDAAFYQGELYVGGLFEDTTHYTNIAKWDGSKWVTVADGLGNGTFIGVNALEVYQNRLYIGGEFNKANGNPGNNIISWDGNQWHELGDGVGGVLYPGVASLQVHNDYLYAGGRFETAGDINAELIARWDGNQWCSLDADFPTDKTVYVLEVHNDTLYVGGNFYWVDSINVRYVAKYIGGEDLENCGAINSISEIPQQTISTFPNPFTTQTTITFQKPLFTTHNSQLHLFTPLGQKVSIKYSVTQNESKTIFHIDRGNLSSGVYFFQIISEEEIIASGKLVVQ